MVMKKEIRLGVVNISSFDPSENKMFGYDYFYDKNHQFHDERCDLQVASCPPDEIVLSPEQEHTLVIFYPTTNPYKAKLETGKKGMTRIKLTNEICKHYRKMYAEEDETSGGDPGHIPGMLNRNTSGGKYGIWGHDIGDLLLCSAYVDDSGEITLGVDS